MIDKTHERSGMSAFVVRHERRAWAFGPAVNVTAHNHANRCAGATIAREPVATTARVREARAIDGPHSGRLAAWMARCCESAVQLRGGLLGFSGGGHRPAASR